MGSGRVGLSGIRFEVMLGVAGLGLKAFGLGPNVLGFRVWESVSWAYHYQRHCSSRRSAVISASFL